MARGLGRVLVGGRDCGAGFALGSRLVITANHVVRGRGDKTVVYVPNDGEAVGVERVQPDADHDAAILWLLDDAGKFLPTAAAAAGANWRVESPPPGANDPHLHGTVTTARITIHNAQGQPVELMQLQVDEQLGDFGGYSGSAVLDSLGRAVLALLVEQKPLRIPVTTLGEKRAVSNVLYAVPIGDVITTCGLPVRAARPLRFDVGLLPPSMVTRAGLLDEVIGRVIDAEGGGASAGLVLLRGPGGLGKTVLARQVAEDVRVWAEFVDGIVMLRAGQTGTADILASQLRDALGVRDQHLADWLSGQRLLLIVDDVWDQELLAMLQASLPRTVTVLATTRGVSMPDATVLPVGGLNREEAVQILARGTARSDELDQVLADLAQTLFHWTLLLTLAAAVIHRDDELGWDLGDDQGSQPAGSGPAALIRRARTLQGEFPDDPTMLDELARTAEGMPARSIEVLVRRSLDWLGPEHRARFELLAIYPPGAAITQPMLEDLWETSPSTARKEIWLLVRAGLAQPVRTYRTTIELHDLVTAWLHYENGVPGDARYHPVHQRLVRLSVLSDGSPGKLTQDRAEWLVHHLVSAGAWNELKALATLRWRSAFLLATGSDAAFLTALDHYGHAARAQAPDATYHAVLAWLSAAHVRALIGALPIRMLVVMASLGDAIAGITQAGQHPSAGEAIPAVLAAVGDRVDTYLLIDRVLAAVEAIPDDWERGRALAGIAHGLAGRAAPADPAMIGRALAVAETIPEDWERSRALAGIATWLAGTAAADPAMIGRALAVAETIPAEGQRGEALADIAGKLSGIDPAQAAALIGRALAVAETIPEEGELGRALAGIAEGLAGTVPADPAMIGRALAVAETIIPRGPRGEALAGIATWLASTAPADPAMIGRAVAVAETITDAVNGSVALASIAGQLAGIDPAQAAALIDRAVAVTQKIPEDWEERSIALAVIAERLAGAAPADPALIGRVLTMAETIPADGRRGEALAGIAGQLAGVDPAQAAALIDRAVAVTQTVPEDWERGRVLAVIAERLAGIAPADPALVGRAVAVAETIPGGDRRGEALAGIAGQLAGIDPAQAAALIDRALTVAETIPGSGQRGEALAGIAGQLAGIDLTQAAALIDRSLAVTQTIFNYWERARALAGIADRLAGTAPVNLTLIDQALAVAQTIPNDEPRGLALAGIATWLADTTPVDPALIGRALAVAETIRNEQQRGWVLAGIARQLAGIDPAQTRALIDQALTMTQTIPDDGERGKALAGIARQLAGIDPAQTRALIDQALTMTQTIPDDWERGKALAGIARQLAGIDPLQTRALIDQALAVTQTIPKNWQRGEALAGIATWLASTAPADPALIDRALTIAKTIPDDGERGEALAGIAERLASTAPADPALIDRALTIAEIIPADERRGQMVSRIHALTRSGMLDELSRWRLRSLGASLELLELFLGNCHDKATAERIGLAVLDVIREFPDGVKVNLPPGE